MRPPSRVEVDAAITDRLTSLSAISRSLFSIESLAAAHASFERIQPFIDGSGRTGRLLTNLILIAMGYPPAIIFKRDPHDIYAPCSRRTKAIPVRSENSSYAPSPPTSIGSSFPPSPGSTRSCHYQRSPPRAVVLSHSERRSNEVDFAHRRGLMDNGEAPGTGWTTTSEANTEGHNVPSFRRTTEGFPPSVI